MESPYTAIMREGSNPQPIQAKPNPGLNGPPSHVDCDNVIWCIAFSTLLKFAIIQILCRASLRCFQFDWHDLKF
jgi:hypothetical protein